MPSNQSILWYLTAGRRNSAGVIAVHNKLAPSHGRCSIQATDVISNAVDNENPKLDAKRLAGFGAKCTVKRLEDTENDNDWKNTRMKAY